MITEGKKKILYAEDEFTNRKLILAKLSKAGYEVTLANDGSEAVKIYQEGFFDLVLLDMYMPGLNGDRTALKIWELCPQCPIIAITSDDEEKPRLLSLGFKAVMVKPLRGTEILEVIAQWV